MIRLPSLSEPQHVFYSGDDAIIQPPTAPDENADEATRKAYEKALEEYFTKIRVARQTGDWDPVTVPGKQPVKFMMRPMPFDGFAVVMGMRQRNEPGEDIFLLAARLCLTEIEGANVRVEFETHERFGKIATFSCFEKFGLLLGLRIVIELGTLAIQRASADPLA